MSRKQTHIVVVAVISLLFVFSTSPKTNLSAKDLKLNDGDLYRYAENLYLQGEYYRSISEYQRLLYFFPDNPFRQKVKLQIGRAYMAGNSLENAVSYWRKLNKKTGVDQTNSSYLNALLGISLLDYEQIKPYHFRRQHIEEAMTYFEKVNAIDPDTRSVSLFFKDWQHREPLKKKSPWLAGGFSAILPGSGSLYTERYMEATYAFFITGLFLWATADALESDRGDLGIAFGLLSLSFYGGNIYTAVNSAHKTNDQMQANQLYQLRQKHGIWFVPETEGRPGRF